MEIRYIEKRFTTPLIIIVAVLSTIIWTTYRLWPDNEEELKASGVTIERTFYYEITQNGKPVLYTAALSADTLMERMSWNKDSITKSHRLTKGYWMNNMWIFPSCNGKLVTLKTDTSDINTRHINIDRLIAHEIDTLNHIIKVAKHKQSNCRYYLRVHGVQDEGYDIVAKFATENHARLDSSIRCLNILSELQKAENKSNIKIRKIETYTTRGNKHTKLKQVENHKDAPRNYMVLQTINKRTPDDVYALSKRPEFITNRYPSPSALEMAVKNNHIEKPDTATMHYFGERNKEGLYHGHGILVNKSGEIYEGHWTEGERDGWGVAFAENGRLRVGEWKKDVFKGERLTYTSDRIYGIDISKHQHIKGKHKYNIDWGKLRITSLGTISRKKVKGSIDYPISYIYIKSTEGKTVVNKFYKKDYKDAKAHGYRVGTYHFFSTTSSATEQAHNFIKNSWVAKGDFPPVLDVEPLPSQIKKMGGPEVMWARVRTWLKLVQHHTGKKPVLYISQNFVNKYLPLAPDIRENYQVWIARYGEYKPDVQLVYWQLCPDGRVKGIHGEVDINVFNGYKDEFEKFKKNL